MTDPPSRRSVLAGLGAGIVSGVAGCASGYDGSRGTGNGDGGSPGTTDSGSDATGPTGCTRPPGSKTETPTTTAPATTTTYGPTSGPDERVDRRPPVGPQLTAGGEWPEHRFDAGNTAASLDLSGVRDGRRYWRVAGGSTPVVANGTMFNVFGRDRDRRALARRDPTTAGACSLTPLVGYGVNTPPVVDGDRAFVTTFVEVFCCATDRDAVLWRGPEMDGIQAPPAVGDGGVYVNSGGFQGVGPHLRALDREGNQRWRYDTDAESKSAPALVDDAVFVVATDGLHAVEAATGERRFHVAAAGERWTDPVATDEAVYVAVRHDDGPSELVAVDPADGTLRWRTPTDAGDHPPVVAAEAGEVYSVLDGRIVALDPDDGSRIREFDGGGAPMARAGDVLYAASEGTVVAYDVGGDRLWSYATEEVAIYDTVGRTVYGVTPVDGAVYVAGRDGFHGVGPVRE